MNGRFTSGMVTGGIIGAAIGTAMISRMGNKKRKRVLRRSRNILSSASAMMPNIKMFK